MEIYDAIFDPSIRFDVKLSILNLIQAHSLTGYQIILISTDENDDVTGSQHAADGGNDFTYRDATWEEVNDATSMGVYDYFSRYNDVYTGRYNQGDAAHFQALVVNSPAYAVEEVV